MIHNIMSFYALFLDLLHIHRYEVQYVSALVNMHFHQIPGWTGLVLNVELGGVIITGEKLVSSEIIMYVIVYRLCMGKKL